MAEKTFDTIIIGAGQYGLALGFELKQRGILFCILDAGQKIGESWRNRYDSLVLFTPNRYNALPGLSFEPSFAYPTKDEVAAYLERYAKHFELPVVHDARVSRVSFHGGVFEAESSCGIYHARTVVVATGAFQKPCIPAIEDDGSIRTLHSSAYRNPSSLPGTKILVVGAGNSAAQIAEELAREKEVTLAALEKPRCVPQIILGKNFLWWFKILGILHAPARSKKANPIIGCGFLKRLKGEIPFRLGEIKEIRNGEVVFGDGDREVFDAILWATGYVRDTSFVEPSARSSSGFFSVGKEKDPRLSSGLLVGAAHDATDAAEGIVRYLQRA